MCSKDSGIANLSIMLTALNNYAKDICLIVPKNKFNANLLHVFSLLIHNIKIKFLLKHVFYQALRSRKNAESEVNFSALIEFFTQRYLPKVIWISEDAITITGKTHYLLMTATVFYEVT